MIIQNDSFSQYLRTLEKQSLIDEQELHHMMEDKDKFLKHAIHNYIKCLHSGSKHDMRAFRLTSLWFANSSNLQVNTDIRVRSCLPPFDLDDIALLSQLWIHYHELYF